MSIRRTNQLILASVLAMSLVTVGSVLGSVHLRGQQVQAYETRRELLKMADQLAAGSDRLTAAVRGYASTGEGSYFEAFQQELKQARTRDVALERLRQGATPEELALFQQAKANSDALVGLEDRAMEAVSRHDLRQAVALVYGDDYKRAKRSIMEPLARGRAGLDSRLSLSAAELGHQADLATLVSLVVLTLNLAAVLVTLTLFYSRRVVNPLVEISVSLQELAAGKTGTRVGYTRESSELGALARALESYRQRVEEAESERWVKARTAEISGLLDGVERPEDFGNRLLEGLVPRLGGGCGAMFLLDEDTGSFHFSGGYGCTGAEPFASGEGVSGQAAAARRLVLLNNLPAGYLKVRSGVGEGDPRLVAALPLIQGERVLAVVEVACLAELTPQQLQLVDEVGAMAALKLEVLMRNLRTLDLLALLRANQE